jgi:tetratricopeptide (TPR) repeat protein
VADYDSAISLLKELKEFTNNTIRLEQETDGFQAGLNNEKSKYRTSFQDAQSLLEKAKYELVLGNYEEAENLFTKAKTSFESEKASLLVESASKKTPGLSLAEFIKKNGPYMISVLVIILMVIALSRKALAYWLRKKKMLRLEKELRVTERMMQELQRKYFVHKKMPRENYDEACDVLQEKIILLKERISLLNRKIKKPENKP